MGVEKGVLFQIVQRAPGAVLTFVFVMVEARDANLKVAGKVLREALISARLMVEGRDARGVALVLNLAQVMYLAIHLLGVKLGYVHLMVPCFRIEGFMVVQLQESSSRNLMPINLLK